MTIAQAAWRVIIGDCIEGMRTLPDQSVHTCVTSPPYFGLRSYGGFIQQRLWGDWQHFRSGKKQHHRIRLLWRASLRGGVFSPCGRSWIGALGLEPKPEMFVAHMVEVFREVRRVLLDDGTIWVNLGDSYAKDKNLLGIPWRVAFALQADGWFLRQDIIWHKPNPMPESVNDRCTKAHEYIFMLSKSARYYYDADAVKEPAVCTDIKKFTGKGEDKQRGHGRRHAGFNGRYAERLASEGVPQTRNRRSVWTVSTKPFKGAHFATFPPDLIEPCILAGCPVGGTVLDPFGGSGTTAGVAVKHGRKAIVCELNPEYAALMPARVADIAGDTPDMFMEATL